MLAGFKSLCIIRRPYICLRAPDNYQRYIQTLLSSMNYYLAWYYLMSCLRSPFSAHSTTMNISFASMNDSIYHVMNSCYSFSNSLTSLMHLSLCFWSFMSKIYLKISIILTLGIGYIKQLFTFKSLRATLTLSVILWALKTIENLPWPINNF